MNTYAIFWECPNCKTINNDAWPVGQSFETITQPIVCKHCGVTVNNRDSDGYLKFGWLNKSVRRKDLRPDDD